MIFLILLFSFNVFADEIFAPAEYWWGQGFKQINFALKDGLDLPNWPKHTLAWPVPFADAKHTLANSMVQFQSYGRGPYYHGGLDLRVSAEGAVLSPVEGRLEAGHYGYTVEPNGSSKKFWLPWPEEGGDYYYFEIAVITADGYRFEFHHINEFSLSPEVLQILNSGRGMVKKGMHLGSTVVWPTRGYHHAHYNIITPSGISLNPEYYSELLPDTSAPELIRAMAVSRDGKTSWLKAGEEVSTPQYLALQVVDHQNLNIYDHPPVQIKLEMANGQTTQWDFTQALSLQDGSFPHLLNFYVLSMFDPDGKEIFTDGGYGLGSTIIKLAVPEKAQGPFSLSVSDIAGNTTKITGEFVRP